MLRVCLRRVRVRWNEWIGAGEVRCNGGPTFSLMLHLLLTNHSSLQDLGDIRQMIVCCLDLWPYLDDEYDLDEDLEDESDMNQDIEDDFETVLLKKLKKALQEVLKEIEIWAQQYETDGLYKDAAYLYGRIHSELKVESRIVPTLAAVYEKMGDYPAAELAHETMIRMILDAGDDPDEEIVPEVETFSRLLNLFHTRLQVLGSASQTYARLSIVYRAAVLDLEQLNAALFDQGLIVLDSLGRNSFASLHVAVKRNALNLARLLLDKGANPNAKEFTEATPLHIAVGNGAKEMVKLLLDWSADTEIKDLVDRTPIQIASSRKRNDSILLLLIEKGAEIETRDLNRHTPLGKAIISDSLSSAQILIRHGADVNATRFESNIERTLLCEAVRKGKEWAVNLLLENGANPQAVDGRGRQALHYAIEDCQESMVKVLLDHGGVKDVTVGPMLLHLAVSGGNLTIIEMILKAGVGTNKTESWGETPLHYLVRLGSTHLAKIVDLLLEFGAQVNIGNQYADTPLHIAVIFCRPEVVQMLIDAGANPYLVNTRGETAMDMARSASSNVGSEEIWKIMHSHINPPFANTTG